MSHGTFGSNGTSRDHTNDMGNKDVKMSLPTTVNTMNTSCCLDVPGGEWILTTPYVSSVGLFLLRLSTLDSHASSVTKARFVEAVLFASVVVVVILSAAAPEIMLGT